jgi:tetratricopeptide (TPR) repeat protein
VIVTSRKRLVIDDLKPLNPELLAPDESKELLLSICPRIGDQADELAGLCDNLPLALKAAASYLSAEIDQDPREYIEELRDEQTRLEKLGKEGVDKTVEASFGLSYKNLPEDTAKVFEMLSVFPNDFDKEAEEEICNDPENSHLKHLMRWGLVEHEEENKRYHMHDLVRIFACTHSNLTAYNTGQYKHAQYYKEVLSKVDELYVLGEGNCALGRDLFFREWTNIKAGQKWAEEAMASRSNQKEPALQIACDYPAVGAYGLQVLLNPRERIRWLETAILAARQLKDSKMEGSHLCNLGIAYCQLGEVPKAINIFQQQFCISRKIGDAILENKALGNLGSAYSMIGETSRAIEFFEQNLFIARMNGDRRGESKSLGNLGLAYYDLGNTDQAIESLEQSLLIHRDIGDLQGEAANLGNLGLLYARLGKLRKAIDYHKQQAAIAREIGDRCSERVALGNLGDAYCKLGNIPGAIEYYKKKLIVDHEIGDHQEEKSTLEILGSANYDIGNVLKSIECYEQALEIAREIGDKQSEEDNIGNLGNAYYRYGDAKKAMELYYQAFVFAREIGDKAGKGNSLFNMSLLSNKLGQRDKAVEFIKAALEIFEQIESPYAEQARKTLASWLEDEKPE